MSICAGLGVLYYVVYNQKFWQRDRHQPFELYKLEAGIYRLQIGEPYWMPEVGLGIGRYQANVGGLMREILTWYDEQGNRHLSVAERVRQRAERVRQRAERVRQRAAVEKQRRERLEAFVRSRGYDPDNLPEL
jgi:hypothetical protein